MIVLILSSHRFPMYILEKFSKMLSESGNSKSKWPQYLGFHQFYGWKGGGDGKKQFLYLSDSVSLVWLRNRLTSSSFEQTQLCYSLWIKGIDTHTEQTPLPHSFPFHSQKKMAVMFFHGRHIFILSNTSLTLLKKMMSTLSRSLRDFAHVFCINYKATFV